MKKKGYKSSKVMMKDRNGMMTMFNSITAAAEFAGANSWTMSLKMQVFGYFEDKNGCKYYRMDEMKTKNEYTSSSPKMIKKQYKKRIRKVQKIEKIEKKEEKKEENIIVNTNDPAIEAINEKIVSILKKAGVYEEIQKLSNAIKKLSK